MCTLMLCHTIIWHNYIKNHQTNSCVALKISKGPCIIKLSVCTHKENCCHTHTDTHRNAQISLSNNKPWQMFITSKKKKTPKNCELTVALKSPWAKNSSLSGSRGLVEMRRSKKRIPASSWLLKFIVCVANHFLISFLATVPKTETKFCTVSGCSGPTGDASSM